MKYRVMLVVRGAELVWTGTREVAGADVVIDDRGRVFEGSGPFGGAETLDASGCVITPGLINAHHHLLQSAFRTLPGTRHLPMREWLAAMGAAYRQVGVDAELCSAAAGVAAAESLLSGVTTVADHHLTWPPGGDHLAIASATWAAARALGIRLVFVRGTAGDDPEEAAASVEAMVFRFGEHPDALVQLAVGPAGVHSDGPETFRSLREVAARHGLRRRTRGTAAGLSTCWRSGAGWDRM
jgi:8-oxoguanine deaminase